jgi:hypothetical protein
MSTTIYRSLEIDGLKVFYREAGRKGALAFLLLHGLLSAPFLPLSRRPMPPVGRTGCSQP